MSTAPGGHDQGSGRDRYDRSTENPRQRLDRQFGELLQELRVAQTGVQLLFGFLLLLPFSAGSNRLVDTDHILYALTLVTSTAALGFLMSPVLVHRALFQRKRRPELVVVSHWLAVVGLLLLMVSVLCAVALVARVALGTSGSTPWIIGGCVVIVVGLWVVLPLALRLSSDPIRPPSSEK
ncbi:MAG: hypothetical protein EPO13_03340 [Actinomycetota bacterium]|nr:MAG: hypothetical protein EPO13_03340 [Actinomycetota bacterium]